MTITDRALDRLRQLDDRPDFSGTRYELGDEIGRGGMGLVFRAHDRELDRDVAVKVTAWRTALDAARLTREARTLASLEHAGIVPVHDVGRLADGRVFLVMSLIRGERLDAHATPLPVPDRLRLFDRVCDTVAFAHARGVVHRDLKPANIMVGAFGQVQILDWGLAGGSEPGGTDGYMAPEQDAPGFDARVDVYALGRILEGLAAARRGPLASIVARATAVDPAARYAGAADLAADVRRFTDGDAVLAHREGPLERTARFARTYRTPIALVLTYLAVRILLLLWAGR
jgi:serine/threonine-protein kinase